jgi:hypothetical protein
MIIKKVLQYFCADETVRAVKAFVGTAVQSGYIFFE